MAQSKAFDSNDGQWPRYSGFRPFSSSSSEIRVLQLEEAFTAGTLRYSLKHAKFASSSYAALSYSWGAPVPSHRMKVIFVEGEQVLIRPTLYAFLETLAGECPSTSLWTDALCINQSDVEERNQQVAMMGEIYKMAEKTYVWLGIGDDDTNYAFEHLLGSNPQTPFDQQQLFTCVDKLFKASYWTRRWIIQEFALSKDVLIVCGSYLTPWTIMVTRISTSLPDEPLLATMSAFQEIEKLGKEQDPSLVELMLRFKAFRCIDRRDRAFALRAIARDGKYLTPDYKESIADVYFRILSQLPTRKVLPPMTGYRWPDVAAAELHSGFQLTRDDILCSLGDKPSDMLFAVFRYVGVITSVDERPTTNTLPSFTQNLEVDCDDYSYWLPFRYDKPEKRDRSVRTNILGAEGLKIGDLVYSLRTSTLSPIIHIGLRPNVTMSTATGILIQCRSERDICATQIQDILRTAAEIIPQGIVGCSRNSMSRSVRTTVICHINRAVLVLLWLLEQRSSSELWRHPSSITSSRFPICRCLETYNNSITTTIASTGNSDLVLEALPTAFFRSEPSWTAAQSILWDAEFQDSQLDIVSISQPDYDHYYKLEDQSDISYAAAEGLLSWLQYSIGNSLQVDDSENQGHEREVDRVAIQRERDILLGRDESRWSPLQWAISNGQVEAVKYLLNKMTVDEIVSQDHDGYLPLMIAVGSGSVAVVEFLLSTGYINVNDRGYSASTPLAWAVQKGDVPIIQALLAAEGIRPDAEDVDGMTPLLWATRYGYEDVTRLLLGTKAVDCNVQDNSRRTPLSWAAEKGYTEIVKLLLAEDQIDPDLFDGQRWTPLRYAAKGRSKEVFDLLLATGRVRTNVEF